MTDSLFNIRPTTDFEKLLWAESLIKELRRTLDESEKRNGILQSEIDELKDTGTYSDLVIKIKEQKEMIQKLNDIIGKLRKDNNYFICKLNQK